jgi:hypothetical protein
MWCLEGNSNHLNRSKIVGAKNGKYQITSNFRANFQRIKKVRPEFWP